MVGRRRKVRITSVSARLIIDDMYDGIPVSVIAAPETFSMVQGLLRWDDKKSASRSEVVLLYSQNQMRVTEYQKRS